MKDMLLVIFIVVLLQSCVSINVETSDFKASYMATGDKSVDVLEIEKTEDGFKLYLEGLRSDDIDYSKIIKEIKE